MVYPQPKEPDLEMAGTLGLERPSDNKKVPRLFVFMVLTPHLPDESRKGRYCLNDFTVGNITIQLVLKKKKTNEEHSQSPKKEE